MKKKIAVFAVSMVLVAGLVSGSLSWLLTTDQTAITAWGGTKMKVLRFTDNEKVLHNPLMGWQYYFTQPNESNSYGFYDEFDVIDILTSWDRLEPQEGQYDWTQLDADLKRTRDAGKTAYLRFYLISDNVWKYDGTPEWIWSKYNIKQIKVAAKTLPGEDYTAIHPDYTSKIYQEKMRNFLMAFAEKYPDGAFDIIDARGYGIFGEWDTGWGRWDWDGNAELKTNTLNELVDIYNDAFGSFKYTQLAVCVAPNDYPVGFKLPEVDDEEYKKQTALDTAMRYGWGIRYDGIGEAYMPWLFPSKAVEQYFPKAPVFGETFYGSDTQYDKMKTLDAFLSYHMNTITYGWFIGNFMDLLSNEELYTKGMLNMGYRLLPKSVAIPEEVRAGDFLTVKSVWENRAVGVCFRQFPLQVILKDKSGKTVWSGVDSKFDQSEWIKGRTYRSESEFDLPGSKELPKGTYSLYIALVDDRTNKPAIALPIDGEDGKSREYLMGELKIV